MLINRASKRIEQMLDDAVAGRFRESDYDETELSRIETKWKRFLGTSALSRENLLKEKENIKSLVSDISHQTKTPVANIRLYTELLNEKLCSNDKDAQREQEIEMLREISRQTDKLEFLIQSLTKMSRLESNILEVQPAQQGIRELLESTVADILPTAEKKQIKIINNYVDNETAFYDMKWTKEALYNVLDNAVKYSPVHSVVTVSVRQFGLYSAVSVKDQGIGIREEDTSRIFGRFYRAEDVQQEDGVGIGLYLTREILKKEGGYVKVNTSCEEGTEFLLYLRKEKYY